ncbi:hypothetical protein GCM10023116_20790 [Kistimonas scapharcae]|uniref:Tetratricopeptide repeat protein n=2 Tax=Kistimonas scapharcae TaxID=1036133 RepID=A0ABP8V0R3_9GAMM
MERINKAQQEADNKNFTTAITTLNAIFSELKEKPDHYVLWKAARQMAFTAGYAGDYFGAIQYFELYKKHTDFINPSDEMFFAGLSLGIDLFSSSERRHKLSFAFPSFNPLKAMKSILLSLRGKKGDYGEWTYAAEQHAMFQPILDALRKIEKGDSYDIADEISKLSGENILYGDMLTSIGCMKCIEVGSFDIAEKLAKTIQSPDHSFLSHYLQALCAHNKGEHDRAFVLYQQEYEKYEPVFKEFADLCLMINDYEKAIEIYLHAEEYYSTNDYPHEAAYYHKLAQREIYRLDNRMKEKAQKVKKESSTPSSITTTKEIEEKMETHALTEKKQSKRKKAEKSMHTRKKEKSADEYYYLINNNIDNLKFSGSSMLDEDDITAQIHEAVDHYPKDKWILHTAGWWFYEQGEEQQSKTLLLRGLQGVLPVKFNYKLPDNIHQDRQLTLRIKKIIETLLKDKTISPDDENSWDIASFLSAYAYHLITQQQFELAGQLRNLADTLDTRRRKRISQRVRHQPAIQVVSPELFGHESDPLITYI